jgi:hypothetical protein
MGRRVGVKLPIIGVYDYGRGIYGVWWYAAWGYGGNYIYFFTKCVIGVLGSPTPSKNRARVLPDNMSCPYYTILTQPLLYEPTMAIRTTTMAII